MTESVHNGRVTQFVRPARLVNAAQIARDTEVRQSPNGVRFATFGETGLADLDLDRMLQAVPIAITEALKANTYYFVPLAMRELTAEGEGAETATQPGSPSAGTVSAATPTSALPPAMVASAYSEEFSDAAICHRNVDLDQGRRGIFISTRLMGDRFALSFEFFINVAHAFVDQAGVPPSFSEPVWQQALRGVRGETSIDAWEMRNLAFGRPANAPPESMQSVSRRTRAALGPSAGSRSFTASNSPARERAFARTQEAAPSNPSSQDAPSEQTSSIGPANLREQERGLYLEAAFSDALAIYLLSLALDIDYSELREREYPLLQPSALAERLRLVADLFPPNPGYEFAVRYRRRA